VTLILQSLLRLEPPCVCDEAPNGGDPPLRAANRILRHAFAAVDRAELGPLFCEGKKTTRDLQKTSKAIKHCVVISQQCPLLEDQVSSMSSGVARWHHEAFDEPETLPAATTPEEYRGGASGSLMPAPFDDLLRKPCAYRRCRRNFS